LFTIEYDFLLHAKIDDLAYKKAVEYLSSGNAATISLLPVTTDLLTISNTPRDLHRISCSVVSSTSSETIVLVRFLVPRWRKASVEKDLATVEGISLPAQFKVNGNPAYYETTLKLKAFY
jgi:hypothetical protein